MTEVIKTQGLSFDDKPKQPDVAVPQSAQMNQMPMFGTEPKKISTKKFNQLMKQDQPMDIKKHQEHVLMLSRYASSPRFGDYLKEAGLDLKLSKLKKMNVEELEELLVRVKTTVANKTISDVWTDSINGGVAIAENVVTSSKLGEKIRISGLSEALAEDETWLDLLEEIKLDNQNIAYVSPQVRVTYTILTTAARVHAINTLLDRQKMKMTTTRNAVKSERDVEQDIMNIDEPKKITTKKEEPKMNRPKQEDIIALK